MPDLRNQLRTYVEETIERVDLEDVVAAGRHLGERRRWVRHPVIVFATAAVAVLVVIGGTTWALRSEGTRPATDPVVATTAGVTTTTQLTTSTQAPNSLAPSSAGPQVTTWATKDVLYRPIVALSRDRFWGTEHGLEHATEGFFDVIDGQLVLGQSTGEGAVVGRDGRAWRITGRNLEVFDGTSWQLAAETPFEVSRVQSGLHSGPGGVLNPLLGPDGAVWILRSEEACLEIARWDDPGWGLVQRWVIPSPSDLTLSPVATCDDYAPDPTVKPKRRPSFGVIVPAHGGELWIDVGGYDGPHWFNKISDEGVASYPHEMRMTYTWGKATPDGSLWLMTAHQSGRVFRFHEGTEVPVAGPDEEFAGPNGTVWNKHTNGSDFDIAPDGTLWIGTTDGLIIFDGDTWDYTFSETHGIGRIDSISVAPDGTVWAAVGARFADEENTLYRIVVP